MSSIMEDKQIAKLTVDQAYAQAVDHFNAGEYLDADKLCAAILQTVPNHVDAINLLGVVAQRSNRHDFAVLQFQRGLDIAGGSAMLLYNLGISLELLGQYGEAVDAFRSAIELQPDNITALGSLGAILKKQGKLDLALPCYEKIVALRPLDSHVHYNLGNILSQIGKLDAAVASYNLALTIKPDCVDTLNNLGNTLVEQGKLSEALKCFEKESEIDPDSPDCHFNIGNTLKKQGRVSQAVASYKKALDINPDYVDAHYNIGNIYKEQNCVDEAVASYEKTIQISPGFVDAYNSLGELFFAQGKFAEAAFCYEKTVCLDPENAFAYYNLGNIKKEQGKLNEAVVNYQKAINISSDFPEALNNLGSILKGLGRVDMAVSCYKKALVVNPNSAEAHFNLATAYKSQGDLDSAIAGYQNALASKPGYAEACFALSTIKKITDFSEIENLKKILDNEHSDSGKIALHFALGKALEDMQQDAAAFDHYIAGNLIERDGFKFNIADEKMLFNKFKTQFDAEFFKTKTGFGCIDNSPIFIVGMPRSGSTLIEQILSTHDDVFGAGELIFLMQNLLQKTPSNLLSSIPDLLADFREGDYKDLGEKYIEQIRGIDARCRFITDKMPVNFLLIGIIKLILPNAKIIHSVRSAEDTCLSIFRTRFAATPKYAYDLTELGEYYRLYREIMSHWHSIFPASIYDCHYEKLTENQEDESRKLLEFCGLDWDEKCLDFHKSQRSVLTASDYQVRQPMYRSSVGGWRRYEKQLQPLIKALGDLSYQSIY
ncbi:MAG: tetratricopeptide repeat protein [Magnetococcales bacterium]|nr:tetratricopeptide repeat protein [Magnetococcales bacterium]